ncbi:hypothetical protein DFJ74DRAFT_645576 [Hyaloraphidium curvatum]|nr:hypothetical protein DFJ74DRAFT_645576 [Hyaloraphidium curvatum]
MAADGMHSVARPLLSDDKPVSSSYVAYRGTLPADKAVRELGVSLKDVVVYVGPKCHLVQYPLRAGEMFNLVAVFESPKAVRGEADWGTPDELDGAFAKTHPGVRECLPNMWRDKWWRMFTREPIMDWVKGRIALTGDAAHPPLQYLAQGAVMAIEDAWVLSEHVGLAGGPKGSASRGTATGIPWERVLQAYNAVRPEHCRRVLTTAWIWGDLWHLEGEAREWRNRVFEERDTHSYDYVDWLYGPTALYPEHENKMFDPKAYENQSSKKSPPAFPALRMHRRTSSCSSASKLWQRLRLTRLLFVCPPPRFFPNMTAPNGDRSADAIASEWLAAFGSALSVGAPAGIAACFSPEEAHWRDILAFSWDIRTTSGAGKIAERLAELLPPAKPRDFRFAEGRTPPRSAKRGGRDVVEAIISFETAVGPAFAVARLVKEGDRHAAVSLMTVLDEIRGHEDPATGSRWQNVDWKRNFGGENWLDRRNRARAYTDHDPAVLVVGAGQAGLSLAARLTQLGIDALVVDREKRIGDNWRTRYHALTLHNETRVNHLPYMPFPPNFPVFIPKDMLANWFELYAEAMELNVWTETELSHAVRDEAAGCWTAVLKRADGTERLMRPRHVVFATGVSSIPLTPDLPGLSSFKGTVVHAGHYGSGLPWRGTRALVVGTGTSGHDVAQDLTVCGAHATLIQRSPTMVVSLKEAQSAYALYDEPIPFADKDLLAVSTPFPILRRVHQSLTAAARDADRPLLDALAARGFRLAFGHEDTGWQIMYQQHGGGYYFNAGASEMIADGAVGLLHWDDLEAFCPEGAKMKDGTVVPADLVVLATGYASQRETARLALGDAVAEKIGPIWGFDDEGELQNMFRPTPQRGLWFIAGSLAQCRIFSKVLALQIKARELGIVDG